MDGNQLIMRGLIRCLVTVLGLDFGIPAEMMGLRAKLRIADKFSDPASPLNLCHNRGKKWPIHYHAMFSFY